MKSALLIPIPRKRLAPIRGDAGFTADKTCAFTLVEILIVIGIIAVMVAILVPVFISSRRQAQRTTCLNNLRQLGITFSLYTQDNDGVYPRIMQDATVPGKKPTVSAV